MEFINFDANAGHTLLPVVREFLGQLDGKPRNPSSVHQGGQRARALIEEAREQLREYLKLPAHYAIVFTSGATEANNLAFSLATGDGNCGSIVTTAVEHPCVLACAERAAHRGFKVITLPVQRDGTMKLPSWNGGEDLRLASIMWANNETGHCFPVRALFGDIHTHFPGCLLHSDIVAALGKIPLSLAALELDMATISGHKIGALSGVGALIVNTARVQNHPLLVGGPQEQRWRAGTENVIGIASLGLAVGEMSRHAQQIQARLSRQKRMALQMLHELVPNIEVHDAQNESLANTISIRVMGCPSDDLVVAADTRGLLLSSGAACASGKPEPSHVLRAMGFDACHAAESIRLSLEMFLEDSTVEQGVNILAECIATMRGVR